MCCVVKFLFVSVTLFVGCCVGSGPTQTETGTSCLPKNGRFKAQDSPYYSDSLTVQTYTHFHYSDEHQFGVANFAKAVADIAIETAKGTSSASERALDLGCSVGRSSFELASHFNSVFAVDFSDRKIEVGREMQQTARLDWMVPRIGAELFDRHSVTAEQLGYDSRQLDAVTFSQGDAHNLNASLTAFDLVLASNLIDRLSKPKTFLRQIHQLINGDGLLVLVSPYDWDSDFTRRDDWIGGKSEANGDVEPFDELTLILGPKFEFISQTDVPYVIRKNKRTYEHSISHCTVWLKK